MRVGAKAEQLLPEMGYMPDWPFEVGDVVTVEARERTGRPRRFSGRVVSVTRGVLTIDAGKYRESVARWSWYAGYTKVTKFREGARAK